MANLWQAIQTVSVLLHVHKTRVHPHSLCWAALTSSTARFLLCWGTWPAENGTKQRNCCRDGEKVLANVCFAKYTHGMTMQDLSNGRQVFQLFVEAKAAKL